jgi:type IV pilus assembly protein PilF
MRALLIPAVAALLAGCPGAVVPTCDQKVSDIHYNLAIQAESHQDVRSAVNEAQEALRICSTNYQAENMLGVLLHVSFQRRDEAEHHLQAALRLKPEYSEAKVNLGNLYLDEKKCDLAIPLYEATLKDMFYRKPWLPLNNEGWCWHLQGDDAKALSLIAEGVRISPEFCQGYRNRGLIYFEQKNYDVAHTEFEKLLARCPDLSESHYQMGRVMEALGLLDPARAEYARCRDLAKDGDPLLDLCATKAGITTQAPSSGAASP